MVELLENALLDGQAGELTVLPTLRQSGGLFSHIIVSTANSGRHAAALTERIRKMLKAAGMGKSLVEASETKDWVLVDCGDVIVHIMQSEARDRFRLEELWGFEDEVES